MSAFQFWDRVIEFMEYNRVNSTLFLSRLRLKGCRAKYDIILRVSTRYIVYLY
jgi:hypothetical protein